MSNWTERVVAKLIPSHTKHVIASDPDGLLNYRELTNAIEAQELSIVHADSSIDARIKFELEIWDSEQRKMLVVGFPYEPLPDMRISAYWVQIGYKDIFPYFDSKALSGLSFNALSTLNGLRPYENLGHDGTVRFLLENLYHIDVEALNTYKTKERVLAAIIEVLFHQDGVNTPVLAYLKAIAKSCLSGVRADLFYRDGLKQHLQKILNEQAKGKKIDLDLSDPFLSRALGNLFVQRILHPVQIDRDGMQRLPQSLRMGFYIDQKTEIRTRFDSLLAYLRNRVASIQDEYPEWLNLGTAIGEAYYLALLLGREESTAKWYEVLNALNSRFQTFVTNTYRSLFSLSGSRYPVVISRVLDHMYAQPNAKKALIVIDGMNLWQWHTISQELEQQKLVANSMATLAYLPTITGWSRQALLKGSKPDLDIDNSAEEKMFRDYWTNKGYQNFQIDYHRFAIDSPFNDEVNDTTEILCLVCNDLDSLMHGTVMGNDQLLRDTQQWVSKSGFVDIVLKLTNQGYQCFITTDHGNIEAGAVKNLSLSTRNLSTSRSKRHIRFVNDDVAQTFIRNQEDLNLGIRGSSVFLRDDTAFIKTGSIITHGGSHILEMIIPLGVIG